MIVSLLYVLLYAIIIAIFGLIIVRILKALGVPIDGKVEQLIYLAFGVLILIWVVSILLGVGGVPLSFPR